MSLEGLLVDLGSDLRGCNLEELHRLKNYSWLTCLLHQKSIQSLAQTPLLLAFSRLL